MSSFFDMLTALIALIIAAAFLHFGGEDKATTPDKPPPTQQPHESVMQMGDHAMSKIMACATPAACAQQVKNLAQNKGYICNYALIRAEEGQGAAIYYRPDSQSSNDGKLKEGTPVYICDEVKGWTNIYYGNLCVQHFAEGLVSTEAKSRCRAGWVQEENLNIISG